MSDANDHLFTALEWASVLPFAHRVFDDWYVRQNRAHFEKWGEDKHDEFSS